MSSTGTSRKAFHDRRGRLLLREALGFFGLAGRRQRGLHCGLQLGLFLGILGLGLRKHLVEFFLGDLPVGLLFALTTLLTFAALLRLGLVLQGRGLVGDRKAAGVLIGSSDSRAQRKRYRQYRDQ